jgi:hypothetical protein
VAWTRAQRLRAAGGGRRDVDADDASRRACLGVSEWAAKAQRRGQSQGGGGRRRSGAGSIVDKMRRAVRTREVLLVDHAILRLATVQEGISEKAYHMCVTIIYI